MGKLYQLLLRLAIQIPCKNLGDTHGLYRLLIRQVDLFGETFFLTPTVSSFAGAQDDTVLSISFSLLSELMVHYV